MGSGRGRSSPLPGASVTSIAGGRAKRRRRVHALLDNPTVLTDAGTRGHALLPSCSAPFPEAGAVSISALYASSAPSNCVLPDREGQPRCVKARPMTAAILIANLITSYT